MTVDYDKGMRPNLYELMQGGGGGSYTLPPATAGTLGGVKIGSGVDVAQDGTISVSQPQPYTLPPATAGTLGGVMVGNGLVASQTGILSASSRITDFYYDDWAFTFDEGWATGDVLSVCTMEIATGGSLVNMVSICGSVTNDYIVTSGDVIGEFTAGENIPFKDPVESLCAVSVNPNGYILCKLSFDGILLDATPLFGLTSQGYTTSIPANSTLNVNMSILWQ